MLEPIYNECDDTVECDNLYFIECRQSGVIKIGRSKCAAARLKDLQIGNPYPLVLLGELRTDGWWEQFWHTCWLEQRLNGEWFEATENLRSAIGAALSGGDWTDHVPIPARFETAVSDLGEWREHLLDASEAYQEELLFGTGMKSADVAYFAIFDEDFDGRSVMSRHASAFNATTLPTPPETP